MLRHLLLLLFCALALPGQTSIPIILTRPVPLLPPAVDSVGQKVVQQIAASDAAARTVETWIAKSVGIPQVVMRVDHGGPW